MGEEGVVKGFGDEETGDAVSAWQVGGDEEADFWEVKRTDDGGGCGVLVVVAVGVGRWLLLKIHCCISPEWVCGVCCLSDKILGRKRGGCGGKKGKKRKGRAS